MSHIKGLIVDGGHHQVARAAQGLARHVRVRSADGDFVEPAGAGFAGGAVVSNQYFGVTYLNYRIRTVEALDGEEVWKGLLKSVVFGLIYATVCCYMGLTTRGGAEGVGRSTTRAVVLSLSGILVANYLLTSFLFR